MSIMKSLVSMLLGTALALTLGVTCLAEADSRLKVTKGAGTFNGTVLFALNTTAVDSQGKTLPTRVLEVDSVGRVVWEKVLDGAMDVTRLDNNDILAARIGIGVTEIDREGNTVWNWKGSVSHHADLLPNGNILTVSTPESWVREIDFDGGIVWEWKAADHIRMYTPDVFFGVRNYSPDSGQHNMYAKYRENNLMDKNDWTHINFAQRLENGNTIINLRNFDLVVEVDKAGDVVWSWGPLVVKHPHSTSILPNGNLLAVDNGNARIIEVERSTQRIVWEYKGGMNLFNQGHAQRLPNGNTFITDSNNKRIILVTPKGEILWEMQVIAPDAKALYRAKYYEALTQ